MVAHRTRLTRLFRSLVIVFLIAASSLLYAVQIRPFVPQVQAQNPSFVYACGGMFCKPDGSRLVLNAVKIYLKPWVTQYPVPTEQDFWALSRAGINAIRLDIWWANLEPQYQVYSQTYISLIDQVRALSQKYGIYIILCMEASSDISPYTPSWLGRWSRVYNGTGLQELVNTWTLLANLFKNNWNLVVYEIPWNEPSPPDYNANNATYVQQIQQGYNMTRLWEQWLQARYGTIQALNATWNAHLYDQLNGTGSPPYRPTDFKSTRGYSGEDQWIGIKPLGLTSYNFHWISPKGALSARRTDWQLFRIDLLANMTKTIALAIRNVDPYHILATFRPNTVGAGQGLPGDLMLPRILTEVPQIQALAVHQYLGPNSPNSVQNQFGYSAYYGQLLAFEGVFTRQLFPNIVFWHDEWGDMDNSGTPVNHGVNQISQTMAQDEVAGFIQGGWDQHYYINSQSPTSQPWTDIVNAKTGEFEGAFYDLRYFMRMQDYSTPRDPDLLLIVPHATGQNFYYETQIFPFLGLHDTVAVADESFVTTSLLNNFKAVIYWYTPGSTGANASAVQTVVSWAKSGHYVLWLGFGNNYDQYYRTGALYSPLSPLVGYLFSATAKPVRGANSGNDTLTFTKSFGDIQAGTTVQIPRWPQGVAFGFNSNNVAQINGLQVVATDTTANTYALWYNGTSVFFYGPLSPSIKKVYDMPFPKSYSDPYLRIVRAFLVFAGVWFDSQTDYNIQYRYDPGGSFLVAYERLGQPGTYTLRLDLKHTGLNPNVNYMLWRAMNWTTYNNTDYVPGSALTDLPLTFQANQTIILRMLPLGTPQVVYSDARLASDAYSQSTNMETISFGANAFRNWTITTSLGQPSVKPTYILNAATYNDAGTSSTLAHGILRFNATGDSTLPVTISYQNFTGFRVDSSTVPITSVAWNGSSNGYITITSAAVSVQVYSSPANVTVLQSNGSVQVNIVTSTVTGLNSQVYRWSTITINFSQGTFIVVTPQVPAS